MPSQKKQAKTRKTGHARAQRIAWALAHLEAGKSELWCADALCTEGHPDHRFKALGRDKRKKSMGKPGNAALATVKDAVEQWNEAHEPEPEPTAHDEYVEDLDFGRTVGRAKAKEAPGWLAQFLSAAEKRAAAKGVVTSRTGTEISGPGGGAIRILDEGGVLRNWEMIRRLVGLLRARAPKVGKQFDEIDMEYKEIEEGEK